jgi:restriction endonuclease S subunit
MSPQCQREIRDKTSVLAIPDLQLGILGNFSIPLPSMDAQREIFLRLDSVASSITVLKKKAHQIDHLRNSLANELLSGRKRVSV